MSYCCHIKATIYIIQKHVSFCNLCQIGVEAVPKRYRTGGEPVPNRCQTGAELVPNRCQTDAKPVPNWCQTGAKSVPNRCQTGAKPLPNRCQTGAKPLPNRCQTSAKTVPKRCQTSARRRASAVPRLIDRVVNLYLKFLFDLCNTYRIPYQISPCIIGNYNFQTQ